MTGDIDLAENGDARLGLPRDADARAVRSAYAGALKKIDQACDIDGFQQLRDAYDAALAYARSPDNSHAPADAQRPASPQQPADAVIDEYRVALARLGERHGDASDAPFLMALRTALADDRLFGLDARQAFEARIAMMLVHGWRPGHEALLTAAAQAFDWAGALRLDGLGAAGYMLECALAERMLFDRQAIVEKQAQRRVIRLLRQQQLPEHAHMAQDLPFFMRMVDCVPHWLAIVAPRERIAYWQEHCPAPGMPMREPPKEIAWPIRILLSCFFLCAVVIYVGMAVR